MESLRKKWLEIVLLLLGGYNTWWTARLDATVAQLELRIERRMVDLLMQPKKVRTQETSW